jgi:hypothetical protein
MDNYYLGVKHKGGGLWEVHLEPTHKDIQVRFLPYTKCCNYTTKEKMA